MNIKEETCRGSKFATLKYHWHKNYFKLKKKQGPYDPYRNVCFLSKCLKIVFKLKACPGIELSPEIPTETMSQVWWRNSKLRVHCESHCFWWSNNQLLTKHLLLHLHVSCLPPFQSPKTLPPIIFFFFCLKGEHFGHFGELPSFHGFFPHICVIKFLFDFLLLKKNSK